jgi:hypothetical protein
MAKKKKKKRDYEKEYRDYHSKPENRKQNDMRKQARRNSGLKVGDPREVDHIKPLSKGGTNDPKNLRVVSKKTNRKKGNKTERVMKQNMTVKKINLRQSIDLGNGKIAKAGSTLYIPMKEGRGDETAARELYLFINNDGDLHRQQTSSIIKNLGKKFKKGVYDRQLAVKLWMYLIDNGAKKYERDYGTPGAKMFDKDTKILAAEMFEEEWYNEFQLGNFYESKRPIKESIRKYYIVLDTAELTDSNFQSWIRSNNIQTEVITKRGMSGLPVVKYVGDYDTLVDMVNTFFLSDYNREDDAWMLDEIEPITFDESKKFHESKYDVDTILDGFLEAALWAETDFGEDEDGEYDAPFDENYTIYDVDSKSKKKAKEKIMQFLNMADSSDIDTYLAQYDESYMGHDLWLTSKGHGAGFWDRSNIGDAGDNLSAVTEKVFRYCMEIWADGGQVYLESKKPSKQLREADYGEMITEDDLDTFIERLDAEAEWINDYVYENGDYIDGYAHLPAESDYDGLKTENEEILEFIDEFGLERDDIISIIEDSEWDMGVIGPYVGNLYDSSYYIDGYPLGEYETQMDFDFAEKMRDGLSYGQFFAQLTPVAIEYIHKNTNELYVDERQLENIQRLAVKSPERGRGDILGYYNLGQDIAAFWVPSDIWMETAKDYVEDNFYFGVQYRDMQSAIHNVVYFDDMDKAKEALEKMESVEDATDTEDEYIDYLQAWVFEDAEGTVEINFRDANKVVNTGRGRVIVVNADDTVPDLY